MDDFENACLEAANSFLQTVVLLDDRAAFATVDGGITDMGDVVEASLEDPDDPAAPPIPTPTPQQQGGGTLSKTPGGSLDAGLITRGFAAKGLVCAVLRPYPHNDVEKETLAAAEHADIVVLDWEMEDKGEKATEIIKHLHAKDEKAGSRLRLIAIYTGHSPLSNVYGALKTALTGFGAPDGLNSQHLTLESAGKTTRIVMLSKSVSPNAPMEKGFAVGEAGLPEKLIEEFAKFAGGLLPNAALAAIAALRSHTHRMLARLDKSLDGPLITHNILVGDAGDPDEFVATVIMEELESQVPLPQIVRRYSGSKSIEAYFEHKMAAGLTPQIPLSKDVGALGRLTLPEVKGLVGSGLPGLKIKTDALKTGMTPQDAGEHDAILRKSLHKRLYFLTGEEGKRLRAEHERFALIAGMRRDSSSVVEDDLETHPVLKIGAVLRCKGKYWVCMTPLCDCVRIADEGGSFLLAELTKSNNDWNVIVQADDKHVKLLADRKRQTVKSIFFGPATGGLIRPVFDESKAVFREVDRDPGSADSYEWLGEMKPMQAQRIVQNFANNIARIGLDEFEWQRRQAPPT